MATFSSVTRQHILQAIAEHDERGTADFRSAYGFAQEPTRPFSHDGRSYDATAVLGVAHRFATGRLATPEELTNSLTQALTILRKRGFELTGPTPPPRPSRPASRTAQRTTRPSTSREEHPTICPGCFTALPATGVCDSCG